MPIGNAVYKKFTASGDPEAEKLLTDVLNEMNVSLENSGLCVVLGGSYARGEGGVRVEREKGLLFNDLDFFVFAEKKIPHGEKILEALAEKYHRLLHVDVDFSCIMSPAVLKKDRKRLMMQELKRNYRLTAGRDLIAEYLPELPVEELPFEEACRLLLNRGMGLLFAADKLARKDDDGDFILRNINKALLGSGDALLISCGSYRWSIAERTEAVALLDIPEEWKNAYADGVAYKSSPHGKMTPDTPADWQKAVRFLQWSILRCAGTEDVENLDRALYEKCREKGETSLFALVKYCLKSRSPVFSLRYTAPAVAVILRELYEELSAPDERSARRKRLVKLWKIFN